MKEALKLALEALEDALNKPMWDRPKMTKAITAIKEALAQDELCSSQEPVGYWGGEFNGGGSMLYEVPQESMFGLKYRNIPLYTAPPKRPWVGLTDEEMQALWDRYAHMEMMRAIEAKLKEKNT